jgi:hypothetical protein
MKWRRHEGTMRRTHRELMEEINGDGAVSHLNCICGKPIEYHTLKESQGSSKKYCSKECRGMRHKRRVDDAPSDAQATPRQ